MIWLAFIVTAIPSLVEAYLDRYGEGVRSKKKDMLWLLVVGAAMTGAGYMVELGLVTVPLLLGMWRITVFDYLVHWFLKKYSKGHKDINILAYSGKTADFDKMISRVDWRVKLAVRGVIMTVTIAYLIWQSI